MIIVSGSHGDHLGDLIAKRLGIKNYNLFLNKFPDDEIYLRFECNLKNKVVVLLQSFYKNISDCIIEVIFAAKTAHELGAKKVILVAPYFPYLRQDKRFHKGEAVSQNIITDLIDRYFDGAYLIDPHLHRKKNLQQMFKIKAKNLTTINLIADYIKKNIPEPIIIGPDEESYKWARKVAHIINADSYILNKQRYDSYHVKVRMSRTNKNIGFRNKNIVIVDDIVSTGHTILETAKMLKKFRVKKVYCICVHGIFAGSALNKLKKAGVAIISTNTVPNKKAKIDVSKVIYDGLV